MNLHDLATSWSTRFGLALMPLFEDEESNVNGRHHVLLDGGNGSFALSVSDERIWRNRQAADWSWSSNLPHHVTVTDREVAVVRWDKLTAELLTRSSVESRIEAFYTYLASDRVKSNQGVTDYMLTIFRHVRSLVADARIEDVRSIDAYLAFLGQVIERSRDQTELKPGIPIGHPEGDEILQSLSRPGVNALVKDAMSRSSSSSDLPLLFPGLAVRHAGSEIFQEAHFELLRAPGLDLFGYSAPAESSQVTRGGAHFTPPALARSVVEQAFAQIRDLAARSRLVIFDPACGSGAFLHEAIRALRRENFTGELIINGLDISAPAVSMAKFVLRNARADWSPSGGCQINIAQGDSLASHFPTPNADIIFMNPPFVAWSELTPLQREQMRLVLGDRLAGRGDLSMAFITRAIENLSPGGVLGTLLPASLLSLQAAETWRKDLLDQAELRFIASIGDYGLFAYALIQVAAAVFIKPQPNIVRQDKVVALVTTNDPDATGNALRTLRRFEGAAGPVEQNSWRLFQTSAEALRRKPTWRLTSPRTDAALRRLIDIRGTVQVGEIFDVRQGVRTGANSVFLLSKTQVEALPPRERNWFRPAVMNESVSNACIHVGRHVFYPYNSQGLAITSEEQLIRLVPTYFAQYLQPQRSRLEKRASIVRSNRPDWWGLSERRAWALDPQPRLVSKYFGGQGGFAADFDGRYIVVQGFAWFLRSIADEPESSNSDLPAVDVLSAYLVLMNSTSFARLLAIFSAHVAGGQFDLSPRYVDAIPIPDIRALATDERIGGLITRLSLLGNSPRFDDSDWRLTGDRLALELYGGDLLDQVQP